MARKPQSEDRPDAAQASDLFVVTVTCATARRRAGFAFGPTPVHLRESDLSEDIIAALKADPALSLRPYEPEPEDGEVGN